MNKDEVLPDCFDVCINHGTNKCPCDNGQNFEIE